MRNFYMVIFVLMAPIICTAQELYRISFEQNQNNMHSPQINTNEIVLPVRGSTVIMGGLDNLDGMGNYLNVYGSKLIIDSLDISNDGTKTVVLRREDGNNFFNMYPTMKAKLTPLERSEQNENEAKGVKRK